MGQFSERGAAPVLYVAVCGVVAERVSFTSV